MNAARGLAFVIAGGATIFGLTQPIINIANSSVFGIPNLVFYLVIVIIIGEFMLKKTVFGKTIYAIGGNENTARLSGIRVKSSKLIVYCIAGLLTGLAGLLLMSRVASANANVGGGYELNSIAASVIGGVSFAGGQGRILGTIVGVLIIGVMQNGLDILNVNPYYQQVLQGAIIAVAVFLDIRSKSKS
jgi:ribose/xylose/arabinose/galactoside ABC-type transport system permease subunit